MYGFIIVVRNWIWANCIQIEHVFRKENIIQENIDVAAIILIIFIRYQYVVINICRPAVSLRTHENKIALSFDTINLTGQ